MGWETAPKKAYKKEELRAALEQSVKSHLMGDVPYGLLISGGLDSSVIAAVAKKLLAKARRRRRQFRCVVAPST